MYRLAWGAVQRGLADALLGYAVALWKRSRPRLLPAPPARLDDDEDAFYGLHHRDCPCRSHPPLIRPLKVTIMTLLSLRSPQRLQEGRGKCQQALPDTVFLVFPVPR